MTCRVAGCTSDVQVPKRQLCRKHYGAAWKAGKLDNVAIWRHTIESYDEVSMAGSCTHCGPGVPVFMRHGRANCRRSARQSAIGYKHGMSRQELDDALADVDNRCEVCRAEFTDENPSCVDHDHACCPGQSSCGECIRGFLCRKCNVGIGMLRDDAAVVARALAYLAKKSASYGPWLVD